MPHVPRRSFERLFKMLAQDKRDVYYIIFFALLNGLVGLSLPLGIQAIITQVMGGQVTNAWWLLVIAVLVAILFSGALQLMQMSISELLQQRIFARAAMDFSLRIPRLSAETLNGKHPPELVNRFFDTMTVQKGLPYILVEFMTSALQIFFGLLLLSLYHPLFILAGVLIIALAVLVLRLTWKRGMATSLEESNYKYKVAFWLEEMARAFTSFKMKNNSDWPLNETDKLVNKYIDSRRDHFRIIYLQFGQMVGFRFLLTAALLILGGVLVINQTMNIGQFVAVEIVFLVIINSAEKIIRTAETVFDVLTALEKIGAVTDLPLDVEEGSNPLDTKMGPWKIRYEKAEQILEVKEGQKVVFSGYSASGRTEFLWGIAGLKPEFSEHLTLNDMPYGQYNRALLTQGIGENFSQEDIVAGTWKDNLCFGRDIPENEIVQVCDQLQLLDYLQSTSKGLHTEINPGGTNLPVSIRRRIILGRALLGNPNLLLLEDYFGQLERSLRAKIVDAIFNHKENRTVIINTNKWDFAMKADHIVIFRNNVIIWQGSPSDLPSEYANEIFYLRPC